MYRSFLAYGIVRLKSLYGFKLKPFVQEGVISATLDNGQKVRSHPSVLKPNCKELTQSLYTYSKSLHSRQNRRKEISKPHYANTQTIIHYKYDSHRVILANSIYSIKPNHTIARTKLCAFALCEDLL